MIQMKLNFKGIIMILKTGDKKNVVLSSCFTAGVSEMVSPCLKTMKPFHKITSENFELL